MDTADEQPKDSLRIGFVVPAAFYSKVMEAADDDGWSPTQINRIVWFEGAQAYLEAVAKRNGRQPDGRPI